MSQNYPRNCWYVAATSDEVGSGLLARWMLDTPVVLYRQASGAVVALEDRCAHRGYPLSVGRRDGDHVICAYHGFVYDATGRCVRLPSQDNVPAGVCVRAFAVHEEPPLVWIWLGDVGASSLRPPPRLPWLTDAGWASFGDVFHVDANYLLLHEHFLDLTHIFQLYPEAVPPGLEGLPPLDEVEVSETSVSYTRVLPPTPLAEWEAEATGLSRDGTFVRREHGTFVSPALHVGRWAIDAGDAGVYEHVGVQAFTPESPTATHVFFQVARNYATDRDVIAGHLRSMLEDMAVQDISLLETIEYRGRPGAGTRGVNVTADRAAVKARRIISAMVAAEAGRAPVGARFAPLRSG
jgi:nitrite reductase/ring-hydroxylating ferredoxin subunit